MVYDAHKRRNTTSLDFDTQHDARFNPPLNASEIALLILTMKGIVMFMIPVMMAAHVGFHIRFRVKSRPRQALLCMQAQSKIPLLRYWTWTAADYSLGFGSTVHTGISCKAADTESGLRPPVHMEALAALTQAHRGGTDTSDMSPSNRTFSTLVTLGAAAACQIKTLLKRWHSSIFSSQPAMSCVMKHRASSSCEFLHYSAVI